MSGEAFPGTYPYAPVGPPQQGQATQAMRLIPAAMLVIGAAVAFGGSFAPFEISRYRSEYTPDSAYITTGWSMTVEPVVPDEPLISAGPLLGIPIAVIMALALVAAVVLVMTARRPGDPAAGRLAGVGVSGMLIGVVAAIWMDLLTAIRDAGLASRSDPDVDLQATVEVGTGAQLVLVGGVIALAAAVLLMIPRRSPAPVAYPVPYPPYWPSPQTWTAPPQQPTAPQPPQPEPPPEPRSEWARPEEPGLDPEPPAPKPENDTEKPAEPPEKSAERPEEPSEQTK